MAPSSGGVSYCMSDATNPSTCQPLGGGATYTCPGTSTQTCSVAGNCTDSASCAASGFFWYNSVCNSTQQTTTQCPSDQYWNGTACVSSTTPPPASTSCPSGYYLSGSTCVPSSSTICGPDQTWTGTTCVSSSTPPPPPPSAARPTDQLLADIAASLAEIARLIGQLR